MSNEEVREITLRRLMEDNFISSKHCRAWMESIKDASIKYYFRNLASRHSQFAIELSDEIVYYGGKKPFFSTKYSDRNREINCEEDKINCIKKALKEHKNSLLKYQEALCRVYDGSCREVLLRHKAFIEHCVFELKSLKSLLRYRTHRDGQLKEI